MGGIRIENTPFFSKTFIIYNRVKKDIPQCFCVEKNQRLLDGCLFDQLCSGSWFNLYCVTTAEYFRHVQLIVGEGKNTQDKLS